MNQHVQKIQPQMGFCGHFDFFIKNDFLEDFLRHVLINMYNFLYKLHDLF
jgi:hypothetical protein